MDFNFYPFIMLNEFHTNSNKFFWSCTEDKFRTIFQNIFVFLTRKEKILKRNTSTAIFLYKTITVYGFKGITSRYIILFKLLIRKYHLKL